MKEKTKGVLIDTVIYLLAFGVALIPYFFIDNILISTAVFTGIATLFIFITSCIFKDVSIYDPYWSVAPPVMLLINMIRFNLWNVNSIIILSVVLIWAIRLTGNWFVTYKGLGKEDWRYAMYREKYPTFLFLVISFTGLHFIPTIVVYLGLISGLLVIQSDIFSYLSLIGVLVMLLAILLEFLSDRAIHRFLREHRGERKTCNISVWKYSRHPNYLGEMSFWTGLYIYFFFACMNIWYLGLGFLTIIILFLVVSIPMMEKHNLERRIDYTKYKEKTSMLLLLSPKK